MTVAVERVALAAKAPHEGRDLIGTTTLDGEPKDLSPDPRDAVRGPAVEVPPLGGLIDRAEAASNFLKALGHDGRLTILCHLMSGPKSVTALENLLSARQAVVSQQLARLRLEGLVSARREGQAIYYSLLDPKVAETIVLLARFFERER
jgi:ArsR family transcriptional regulator